MTIRAQSTTPASPEITTLWLARHGEVHNPQHVLYGRLPRMRLSPEGTRQAEALADFLGRRPIAAVYSSPMLRARKTAEVVVSRFPGLRVRQDRGLLEIRTGWQGQPLASLECISWDFYAHPRHPEDESMVMIRDRMRGWVRRMLRRHRGGEVVGVTHGDPLLILLADLRGEPMELTRVRPPVYIPTASLFRLAFGPDGNLAEDAKMFVPHQAAEAA